MPHKKLASTEGYRKQYDFCKKLIVSDNIEFLHSEYLSMLDELAQKSLLMKESNDYTELELFEVDELKENISQDIERIERRIKKQQ